MQRQFFLFNITWSSLSNHPKVYLYSVNWMHSFALPLVRMCKWKVGGTPGTAAGQSRLTSPSPSQAHLRDLATIIIDSKTGTWKFTFEHFRYLLTATHKNISGYKSVFFFYRPGFVKNWLEVEKWWKMAPNRDDALKFCYPLQWRVDAKSDRCPFLRDSMPGQEMGFLLAQLLH